MIGHAIALVLAASPVGWAQESGEDASSQASYEAGLPPVGEIPTVAVADPPNLVVGTDYPRQVYVGAASLGLDASYVHALREGLELLYLRRYADTRAHFQKMETDTPGHGVDAVGDVLVYQSMMFENYDFRFEAQWQGATKRARGTLGATIATPGAHPFDHFLLCGVVGIESIHAMRKEQYLSGLRLAFEAMDEAQIVRNEAPAFPDLLLADGIYDYWRTVITESSKVLPHFGDHRAEGIGAMKAVEEHGVFLSAPATLTLVFAWVEEHRSDEAIAACEKNRKAYPDSVINNLVTGRTYISLRKYDTALSVFDHVLATDPTNEFVHYYKGVAEMRSGKLDLAEKSLQTYLGFPNLLAWQRSNAYYRMGQLRYKQARYDDAKAAWERSVKLDGNPSAKLRLEKLKKEPPN